MNKGEGGRCLLLLFNDEGKNNGGRPDIGVILEQRGMELVCVCVWGGRWSYDSSSKVHFMACNPRFGVRPD